MLCEKCGHNNPPEARFCESCGAVLVGAPVSGVGSSYGHAWRQLWKHFLVLLLIGIVYLLLSSVSWVFSAYPPAAVNALMRLLLMAYSILFLTPLAYGVSFAYLKAARDDPVEVKDMFESFRNYWNAVLSSLLIAVIVMIGLVVLIVPGIIFACKLAFTPYLVVDRKMAVIEAVQESWRMTGGHAWEVFLIGLLAIPIGIAGLIALGVGVIVASMWVTLALASLYYAVSAQAGTSRQQDRAVT